MVIKKYLLVLFTVFVSKGWCQNAYAGKSRQDSVNALLSSVQKIEAYIEQDSSMESEPAWQYFTFQFLDELSSNEDWVKYSNSKIPCLRIYSYAALTHRNYKNIGHVRNALLLDTAKLLIYKKSSLTSTRVKFIIKTQNIERLFESKRYRDLLEDLNSDNKLKEYTFKLLVDWNDDNRFKTKKDTISGIIAAMRERNRVESAEIGYVGLPSRQFYRFYFLTTICSIQDWLTLLNDSSAAVRFYSYQALKCKGYEHLDSIKNVLKNDTTKISYTETCVHGITSVASAIAKSPIWISCTNDSFFDVLKQQGFYQTIAFDALFDDNFRYYTIMQ